MREYFVVNHRYRLLLLVLAVGFPLVALRLWCGHRQQPRPDYGTLERCGLTGAVFFGPGSGGVADSVWSLEEVVALLNLKKVTPENTEEAIKSFLMILLFIVLGTDALVRGSWMTWWFGPPIRIHHRKQQPVQFWIYVCGMYATALVLAVLLYLEMKHGFK